MRTYRAEITGTGAWQHTSLAFNANRISVKHLFGAGNIEISFGGSTTASIILSPVGGTYPNEVSLESENSFSQFGVNAALAHTVEVRAWL